MADLSLTRKSARELARLIRTRAVSPVEVLDARIYRPSNGSIRSLFRWANV